MVVRMRATRSHRNNRRSHHALKGVRLSKCNDCGAEHLRHRMCTNCMKYRGRVVVAEKQKKAPIVKKVAAKTAPKKKAAKTPKKTTAK